MINAINNYTIYGVKTTLPFCKFALNHPDFRNGNFDTRFVNLFIEDFKNSFSSDLVMDAGLAAIFKLEKLDAINVSYLPSETNNWKNS
jgi:pyruvate carboxylase